MRCKGPAGAYIFVGARSQDLTIERGALSPVDRGEEPGRIGRLVVERRGRSGRVAGIEAGGRFKRERERESEKEKKVKRGKEGKGTGQAGTKDGSARGRGRQRQQQARGTPAERRWGMMIVGQAAFTGDGMTEL